MFNVELLIYVPVGMLPLIRWKAPDLRDTASRRNTNEFQIRQVAMHNIHFMMSAERKIILTFLLIYRLKSDRLQILGLDQLK